LKKSVSGRLERIERCISEASFGMLAVTCIAAYLIKERFTRRKKK
tara:strand:+ start:251 stop:385 length:135 start_codon:yes stop_codon:yes gene_type:complete